jgi:hypothetical protein
MLFSTLMSIPSSMLNLLNDHYHLLSVEGYNTQKAEIILIP